MELGWTESEFEDAGLSDAELLHHEAELNTSLNTKLVEHELGWTLNPKLGLTRASALSFACCAGRSAQTVLERDVVCKGETNQWPHGGKARTEDEERGTVWGWTEGEQRQGRFIYLEWGKRISNSTQTCQKDTNKNR
jgi:hypothetical protein